MYYVMSDIHGCYSQMKKALKYWDSDNEHLVIMGDIINKGPNSLQVVRKLMKLKKEFPDKVIITKGNHEELFIDCLKNKSKKIYDCCGRTISSFAKNEKIKQKEKVKKSY